MLDRQWWQLPVAACQPLCWPLTKFCHCHTAYTTRPNYHRLIGSWKLKLWFGLWSQVYVAATLLMGTTFAALCVWALIGKLSSTLCSVQNFSSYYKLVLGVGGGAAGNCPCKCTGQKNWAPEKWVGDWILNFGYQSAHFKPLVNKNFLHYDRYRVGYGIFSFVIAGEYPSEIKREQPTFRFALSYQTINYIRAYYYRGLTVSIRWCTS